MNDDAVEAFLVGEPVDEETQKRRRVTRVWFGTSKFRDKDKVKAMARGDGERSMLTWHDERKSFGTHELACVATLCASGLWKPFGISPELAERVAVAATRKIEDESAKKRAEEAAEAEAAATRRRNADKVAAEKAAALRKRDAADKEFSEVDIVEAWARWRLSRELLMASRDMPFLGPVTPTPLTRIARHFNLCHNGLSPEAVIERDFVPAHNRILSDAAKNTTTTQRKKKKTRVEEDPAAVVERLRRAEEVRRLASAAAAEEERTDPHRLAHERIIRNSDAMGRIRAVVKRSCAECGELVDEQFLSCSCDDHAEQWSVCDHCSVVMNPTLAPCSCSTRAFH